MLQNAGGEGDFIGAGEGNRGGQIGDQGGVNRGVVGDEGRTVTEGVEPKLNVELGSELKVLFDL